MNLAGRCFVRVIPALCFLLFFAGLSRATQAPQPAQSGSFDGPAELPRIYMKTDLSATPSPGRRIHLKEQDSLQQALETASCGDTIELQQGAAYRGLFKFPAKHCKAADQLFFAEECDGPNRVPSEECKRSNRTRQRSQSLPVHRLGNHARSRGIDLQSGLGNQGRNSRSPGIRSRVDAWHCAR